MSAWKHEVEWYRVGLIYLSSLLSLIVDSEDFLYISESSVTFRNI